MCVSCRLSLDRLFWKDAVIAIVANIQNLWLYGNGNQSSDYEGWPWYFSFIESFLAYYESWRKEACLTNSPVHTVNPLNTLHMFYLSSASKSSMRSTKMCNTSQLPLDRSLLHWWSSQRLHVYSAYNRISTRRGEPQNVIKANDLWTLLQSSSLAAGGFGFKACE